jgi:hypothetical protein
MYESIFYVHYIKYIFYIKKGVERYALGVRRYFALSLLCFTSLQVVRIIP